MDYSEYQRHIDAACREIMAAIDALTDEDEQAAGRLARLYGQLRRLGGGQNGGRT